MTLQSGGQIWSDIACIGDADAEGAGDRKFVTALARGLGVLRAFTPTDGLLGNGEIAKRTGLPKPTVTRLSPAREVSACAFHACDRLRDARQHAYPSGRAALHAGARGLCRCVGLAKQPRPSQPDLCRARPRQIRGNVAARRRFANPDGDYRHGSRTDRCASAARARLAAHPHQATGGHAGITRGIRDYETGGFTTSIGDWQRDVSGVGLPLVPSDGSSIFVFNCGTPAYRLTRETLEKNLGPRLVNMVRNTQIDLNGR